MEVNRSVKVGTAKWDHKGIATAELAAAAAECAAFPRASEEGGRLVRCAAKVGELRAALLKVKEDESATWGAVATVLQGCSGDGAAELVQLQEVKNG